MGVGNKQVYGVLLMGIFLAFFTMAEDVAAAPRAVCEPDVACYTIDDFYWPICNVDTGPLKYVGTSATGPVCSDNPCASKPGGPTCWKCTDVNNGEGCYTSSAGLLRYKYNCSYQPGYPKATDTCNGLDDDCDGTIDEGVAETCNGIDDDCDGTVDESVKSQKFGSDNAGYSFANMGPYTSASDYACCAVSQCVEGGACYLQGRVWSTLAGPTPYMCGTTDDGKNAWLRCNAVNRNEENAGKYCCPADGGDYLWTSTPNREEYDYSGAGWQSIDAGYPRTSSNCCAPSQCADDAGGCYWQGILSTNKDWVCSDHKATSSPPRWFKCTLANDGQKLNADNGYCCSKVGGVYEFHTASTETSCSDESDNDCDGMTDEEDPDCPITLVISPSSTEHYGPITASIQDPSSVFDDNTNGDFYLCRAGCTVTGTCAGATASERAWNTFGQTSSGFATLTFHDREWGSNNPSTYTYSLCYGKNSDTAALTLTKTCEFGAEIPSICNERDVMGFGSSASASFSVCGPGTCQPGFVPPMNKRKLWTLMMSCSSDYVCPQGYYEPGGSNTCCPLGTSFTNQTPTVYGCFVGGTEPIVVNACAGSASSVTCADDSADSLNVCPESPECTISSISGTTANRAWLCRNGYYPTVEGVCCPVSASYNPTTNKCYMSPRCNRYCDTNPAEPSVPCIVPGKCGGKWFCGLNGWNCTEIAGSGYNCDANCDGLKDSCATTCPNTCGEDCSNNVDDDADGWVDEADADCTIVLNANSPVTTNGAIMFATAATDTPLYPGVVGAVGRNICLGGAGCRTTAGVNNGSCSGGTTVLAGAISGTITAPPSAGTYNYHVCIGNNSATRAVIVNWPPEVCTMWSGDENKNTRCDYDSQTCGHGDEACCIAPSTISSSSLAASINARIAISCSVVDNAGVGVSAINSARAYRDVNNNGVYDAGDAECVWNATSDAWSGNTITFHDCFVGGVAGPVAFRCGIQNAAAPPDRSYRCGSTPDPVVTVSVSAEPLCADTFNGPTNGLCGGLSANSFIAQWTPSTTSSRVPASDKQLLRVSTSLAEVQSGCPTPGACVVKEDALSMATSSFNVPGLTPSTQYHVRAVSYCTNNDGTSYWRDMTWSCCTLPAGGCDVDGDGYNGTYACCTNAVDCNDNNPNIHPTGNYEAGIGLCSNSIDDDCDGLIDYEGPARDGANRDPSCAVAITGGTTPESACNNAEFDVTCVYSAGDKLAVSQRAAITAPNGNIIDACRFNGYTGDIAEFTCTAPAVDGIYNVTCYVDPSTATPSGPSRTLEFRTPCTTTWSGRLIDAATGAPITTAGGAVADGIISIDGGAKMTAGSASFTFNTIQIGTHSVWADAEGYDPVSDVVTIVDTPVHRQNITLSSAVCTASCSIDGYCDYACLGQNGCAWNPAVRSEDIAAVKNVCDGTKSGVYRRFNDTHYVLCCTGGFAPIDSLRVPFSIQTSFRQVFPHTRTVLGADGKFYQLVSLAVGGKD